MMNCRMERIEGGSALRTNIVNGTYAHRAMIGKSFQMFASPIVEGFSVRIINTSPVVSIDQLEDNTVLITTQTGSQYKVSYE